MGCNCIEKAVNFTAAMARAAKAFAVGDPVFVSTDEWEARLAVCVKCDHFQKATATTQPTCALCGCVVKPKAWMATEPCPDNRWPSVTNAENP
jgi:hypothetical protein